MAGAASALLVSALLGMMGPADEWSSRAFGEPLDTALVMAADLEAPPPADIGIVIDVGGAVARPGLHRLHAGDRVGDAIEAAGGYAPRVDLVEASLSLNLAQPLEDGTKVLVPELGIDRPETGVGADTRIDLNRAGQAELESLPGIGPVTARKIIDARDEKRFGNARELRSRGLVGESVFADIEALVTAG